MSATLKQLCMRVLLGNIVGLLDVGDAPYRLIRELLLGTTADQLLAIEQRSPHLLRDDEEVWRSHCLRDFVKLADVYDGPQRPADPPSWRTLYAAEQVAHEDRVAQARRRLRGEYGGIEAEKRKHQLVHLDRLLPGGKKRNNNGVPTKPKTAMNRARAVSKTVAQLHSTSGRTMPRPAALSPPAAAPVDRQVRFAADSTSERAASAPPAGRTMAPLPARAFHQQGVPPLPVVTTTQVKRVQATSAPTSRASSASPSLHFQPPSRPPARTTMSPPNGASLFMPIRRPSVPSR